MGCGSFAGVLMIGFLCCLGACSESADAPSDAQTDTAKSAPSAKEVEPTEESPVVAAGKNAEGAAAWTAGSCAACHGGKGTGGSLGPDLTDETWNNCDGTVSGIRGVLVSGVSKEQMGDRVWMMAMPPATKSVHGDSAIDALAEYVHSLSK